MFTVNRVFPGVAHITDAMGVSLTLIEGEKKAGASSAETPLEARSLERSGE